MHPVKKVFIGYVTYISLGCFLLSLPIFQVKPVALLDNLFIATSAVSTTGLVTVSITDSYTLFGQIIILLLIQFGGVGYMTFSSCVLLSQKKVLPDERVGISNVVFSLPRTFRIEKFIKSVVIFTFLIELSGGSILYYIFSVHHVPHPLWSAIFHSISSFCTAGFSLYNTSFESFAHMASLNGVIAVLSYAGAIGFIVFVDIWRCWRGKIKHITLTSKIILWITFWLSVIGTVMLLVIEPSIQHFPKDQRLLAAFFQTMTAMTTVGFNTISLGGIAKSSILLLTVLMVIGSSPSGTGGGIKSTTLSAILGIMKSVLRGQTKVCFWGREIPLERLWSAVASFSFYITFLLIGMLFLELTETASFESILFEAASALGTVGLSLGITATLTSLGKLIIILLMFIGRIGPLTFGMALFFKSEIPDDNDIAI